MTASVRIADASRILSKHLSIFVKIRTLSKLLDAKQDVRPTPAALYYKFFDFVAFAPNPVPLQPAPMLEQHSGPFIANDSLVIHKKESFP
jgi:hypothetical protein